MRGVTHDQFWAIVYGEAGWAIGHPFDVLLGVLFVVIVWRAI